MSEPTAQPSVEVEDVPDRERYVVALDGEPAGFAQYVRRGGRTIFVHTEIDPQFEGHGLGSALAKGALDHERSEGHPIVPLCSFIRAYVDRHPEYMDLVDQDLLHRIDPS